jgi:putative membrane protein
MSALFAFLHHLGAFGVVAALAVELALLRGELTLERARQLRIADAVYGAAAGFVVVIGFLRVFYFEKGAAYYFHSVPFLAKLALIVIVGLLSIIPTLEFASWRTPLREGRAPVLGAGRLRTLRRIVHWEAAGVVLILLAAALMARGVGYFG